MTSNHETMMTDPEIKYDITEHHNNINAFFQRKQLGLVNIKWGMG